MPVDRAGAPAIDRPAGVGGGLASRKIQYNGDYAVMMVDQCVRLGLAIVIIALISLALYQFSGRARAAGIEQAGVTAPAGR
jgi:hypothetical protein